MIDFSGRRPPPRPLRVHPSSFEEGRLACLSGTPFFSPPVFKEGRERSGRGGAVCRQANVSRQRNRLLIRGGETRMFIRRVVFSPLLSLRGAPRSVGRGAPKGIGQRRGATTAPRGAASRFRVAPATRAPAPPCAVARSEAEGVVQFAIKPTSCDKNPTPQLARFFSPTGNSTTLA